MVCANCLIKEAKSNTNFCSQNCCDDYIGKTIADAINRVYNVPIKTITFDSETQIAKLIREKNG